MPFMDFLPQLGPEQLDLISFIIALCLLALFLLVALFGPLFAVVTQSVYTAKGKAFYDKCALQITQMTFGLGLFIYSLLTAATFMIILRNQPTLLDPPNLWSLMAFIAVPSACVVLLTLYLSGWTTLKKRRGMHLTLGIVASIAVQLTFFFGFLSLACIEQPFLIRLLWKTPLTALLFLLKEFVSSPTLWLFWLYLSATGLAATGGLVQLWFILRRNRADYGRDYYTFAMHYAARWAMGFTLAAAAAAAAILWFLQESTLHDLSESPEPGVLVVAFGLPLCCAFLWWLIIRSGTPLRHKPGAFFACFFFFTALCAQVFSFAGALPMP